MRSLTQQEHLVVPAASQDKFHQCCRSKVEITPRALYGRTMITAWGDKHSHSVPLLLI